MYQALYRAISGCLSARNNCEATGNTEWYAKHTERLEKLVKENMPSGSGFDAGTTLDLNASTPEKLIFRTSYHHMNDVGFYSGWTEHTVTVRASLWSGLDLKISGRDRNQIKDAIYEVFYSALCSLVDEHGRGFGLPAPLSPEEPAIGQALQPRPATERG